LVAFGVALGVLVVAIAFGRGRANQPWSGPLYWVGESVVFLVPAGLLLKRRAVTLVEGAGLAVIIAVATYAIKVCFSPLRFTFSDEYEHYTTLQSILTTHQLFHANPNLPVSPYYPGLEIVTSSFAQLSHLSIYASSAVVLGVVHLIGTLALFYLAFEIIPNARVAAITVFIYATGSDYRFFTSYFAYESLALPIAILALLAIVKMVKSTSARSATTWGLACFVLSFVTVVTHHVSSYFLIAMEVAILSSQFLSTHRTRERRSLVAFGAVTAGVLVVWDLAVARSTFSYLQNAVSGLLLHSQSVPNVSTSTLPIAGPPILTLQAASQVPPAFDHYMSYVWAVLLSVSLASGLWLLWRQRRGSEPLLWAMAVASPVVYLGFVIQVFAFGGSELGTRLTAFSLIPGGVICALAINEFLTADVRFRRRSFGSWPLKVKMPALYAFSALLAVGSIAASFPPFYAHLPGPYIVGGELRSVDEYDLSAAQWAAKNLPPGNVMAGDLTNSQLMASIGQQTIANGDLSAFLLSSTSISPAIAQLISSENLHFIVVDERLTTAIPVDGNPLFPDDPFAGHYRKPIPLQSVKKFNEIRGVSRIFVDGPISIYDLQGSTYSSQVGQ
jgi:hypothetical protein